MENMHESISQPEKGILKNILGGRFIYLLACLVTVFVIYPFLDYENFTGLIILEICYLAVLLACLRVVTHNAKPLRFVVIGLLMLTVATRVGEYFSHSKPLLVTGFAVEIILYCIICVVIIGHVMKAERVTPDKIIGAICAYLFIGALFALLFALMETLSPGSFAVASQLNAPILSNPSTERGVAFFYFSFITLTTVGYGDVSPVSQPAATFSALEAVTGQIYLTVLVARLVGLNIAYSRGTMRNIG